MSVTNPEPKILAGKISEKTLKTWKAIQMAAILPLLLSIVFLWLFKGSLMGTIVFFLILIVGIILPQIYRDFIQSQLALKVEIETLRNLLPEESSEGSSA